MINDVRKNDARFATALLVGLVSLLILSSCSSVGLLNSETTPTSEILDGQIAFISPAGNLYWVAPEGGTPQAITSDAEHSSERLRRYQNPTWDPSSNALAYIELVDEVEGLDQALVHVLWPGEQESAVVFRDADSLPIYLDWSNQGSQLTILSSRVGISELRMWVADGTSKAVEMDFGQPYYWDWSQDGERLFVHVGGSAAANPEGARLSLFSSIGSAPVPIDQSPGSFRAPAYRPNQGGLLVALESQPGSRLALLDESGAELSSLAEVEATTAFSWSADGERVAYAEGAGLDPEFLGELIILEMDGVEVANRLDTGLDSVAAFFWSPDGRQLAAFVPELAEPRQDQLVSSSPQGSSFHFRLVLVDAVTGEWADLAILKPTSDWLSVVTYHDQYQRSGTIWSPAGDAIVYTSERTGGNPGVYVVGAEPGAESNLIAEGTVAFWSMAGEAAFSQRDE